MKNELYDMANNQQINLRDEVVRYLTFWPYLLLLVAFLVSGAFLYLRYATYLYKTSAVIEIIDEAQDSEMALPTELTVFNRSMINLENEINILNSFNIHKDVVSKSQANVIYYKIGNIKTSLAAKNTWIKDYELNFKIDTDTISSPLFFSFVINDKKLVISEYNSSDDLINQFYFESLSTVDQNHSLPFDIEIKSFDDDYQERRINVYPVKDIANQLKSQLEIQQLGIDSDQLTLTMTHENYNVAEDYLNELLIAFDNDGINDRKLEYQRTIEFVNERELILKKELEVVELRKQNFKQANNLSDLSVDAVNNIDLKYSYNSEIFQAESQRTIAVYLLESLSNKKYDYLPINIGLENFDLNNVIVDYNKIVSQRNKYLSEAGPDNVLIKSIQSELENLISNISASIQNYLTSIDLKIDNLKSKEFEFESSYSRVPENEKTLRSIERELTIKEALYLLLLQKREEAAINLAVVRPTIKIIDYPITNLVPQSPNPRLTYLYAIFFSIFFYFLFLYLRFTLDNKIHNKEQLVNRLNPEIPVICEIPFISDKSLLKSDSQQIESSRSVLSESIRMLISNLRFFNLDSESEIKSKTLVFTSSIKGEGKTLASVNTAIGLANDINKGKKVILLGSDLRNPQVHKSFGVEKSQSGISEIIYNNDYKNYKNYIRKFGELDVLFSGSIPPNPTAMLGSEVYKNLINLLKIDYDYIVIDSAPCLLVSDTFQYLDLADSIIYMFRSNYTDSKITNFINEIYDNKKAKNLKIVFNAVGNSESYGYKYGYQYGYKYGYKYSYNYGYGYGYGDDKK